MRRCGATRRLCVMRAESRFAALRREAEQRPGETFDIRAFHDRVLESGAPPPGALRAHVEAWVTDEEAAAAEKR